MATENLRIGVWIENGKVFRRDSEKEPFARIYIPKNLDLIDEVFQLARSLHSGATLPSWTAQVEAMQDDQNRQLRRLIFDKKNKSAA